MKKVIICLACSFFLLGTNLWAQDGNEFGFGLDTEANEDGFGFNGDDSFGFTGSDDDPLQISVTVDLGSRYYILEDSQNYSIENTGSASIDFDYIGDDSEARITLELSEDLLSNDPGKVLDEVYFKWFLDGADFQLGYFKTTWGKADGIHVLDVLNPKDYSDFTNPEPLDLKIAEAMIMFNVNLSNTGRLEMVYQPLFTPNTIPTSGRWAPEEAVELNSITTSPNLPDTGILEYGSAGLRYTDSVSFLDFGIQYFTGFWRIPAVELIFTPLPSDYNVSYNRYHQIGLDFAMVLGGLNIWSEAAFNLTSDFDGDDPLVYNPRFDYIVGFDLDLFADLNLNFQTLGNLIFLHDQISSSLDVEDGSEVAEWTLIAKLSGMYIQDKLDLSVTGAWNIKGEDGFVKPSISFQVTDEVNLGLSSKIFFGNQSGILGYFNDNSFVQLDFTYAF